MKHPVRGSVYTMEQINTELFLRDKPFMFFFDALGKKQVIQNALISIQGMSVYEGWRDLRFTFMWETDEWIPVFVIVDSDNYRLQQLLDSGVDEDGEVLYWPKVLGSFF